MTEVEKKQSFMESMQDQDVKQKMTVFATLILEVYRVLMGAMLIIFVPQSCGGQICTMSDNFNRDDSGATKSAFAINLLTLSSFLFLYKIEVTRENKMIEYLNVNPEKSRDNDSVEESLVLLDKSKKEEIWKLDGDYKKAGYFCMGTFSINSIISLVIIFQNYLNDKTITVLLTNLLFLGLKINDVFTVVNTEKNIFLSSYLTRKIQYNDIDPDHIGKQDEDIEAPSDETISSLPPAPPSDQQLKESESELQTIDLTDKPAEKPEEKPVEKPEEKPAEKPEEKPAEKPEEKPVEKPEDKPAEKDAKMLFSP